ncbi:hypothetical protein [Sphingomonas sp. SAFR-052]|uniref:hypothetical protein n=1 Tax=Sphingomonas sp. SAFR-052 TaxID=3436867 RepID=UPI003F7E26AC
MTTKVELSIAGRGADDAPLLGDLLAQIQDFFEMVNVVAASITGDDVERFDWRVVGLSKNSPARVTVEAFSRHGHSDGEEIAATARNEVVAGLLQLQTSNVRPLYFNDNVAEVADRFIRRIATSLTETGIGDGEKQIALIKPAGAVVAIKNLDAVRDEDPIHPYRELGSIEGHIQNVGEDGYGRPYIIIKNRITGKDVRCILSGSALQALEEEPVANVVWRKRRVTAIGVLRYRSIGKLSQADVERLDFADPLEALPQVRDIINKQFTRGLTSGDYLEKVRNGEA